jgi:hypothetical protein
LVSYLGWSHLAGTGDEPLQISFEVFRGALEAPGATAISRSENGQLPAREPPHHRDALLAIIIPAMLGMFSFVPLVSDPLTGALARLSLECLVGFHDPGEGIGRCPQSARRMIILHRQSVYLFWPRIWGNWRIEDGGLSPSISLTTSKKRSSRWRSWTSDPVRTVKVRLH